MKRTYSTFSESAYTVLDYARCQRPDGTFYGTAGTCRKGKQVSEKQVDALKKAAKSGNKKAEAALKVVEGKTTPKKPTDYERGGTLKGTLGPIAKAEKDKKIYEDQIKKANEYLKKDPEDEFAGFMKERAEKSLKPITNSEKVVEGVTKDVPKGTKVEFKSNGFLGTTFTTPGGTVVTTSFGQGDFNFQVNGKYDAGQITDRKEQMAIARQVQRVWNAHRQNLPEGYVVQATAWGEDGRGASRIRAYKRMGFSDPTSGTDANPGTQYGRIGKGGKVSASDRAEQGLGSTLLMFAEGKDKDTALWYIAIFGAPDKKNDFNEADSLEFARCQRADGTFYGTSGTCRKGTPVGPKEMKALKKAAASGNKRAKAALDVAEGKKTKEQAKKELSGKPTATKPKTKKKAEPDLQTQYSGLAKRAQEAMAKGDMDAALRLNREAMSVAAKIKAQEEKGSPEAKKRGEKIKKVEERLKKGESKDKVSSDSEGVYITDKVGSNEVKTLVTPKTDGSYEIGYKVNDSYTKGGVTDRRQQVRIALTAKRQFDEALGGLPSGTKVRAFAFDEDGGGDVRRKAYEKLGFKHQGNNLLTGVIKNGKIEGLDFAESLEKDEEVWFQIIFGVSSR